MPNRSQRSATISPNPRRERSRWLVPMAIGSMGIVMLALVLVALGVLTGLIRF